MAEEIAEEAGYSRGALHSNFEDKEGLFLEVVRQGHQRTCAMFARLLRESSGDELLAKFRESFADLLLDPDFLLVAELELESLRSEKLRAGYVSFYEGTLTDARKVVQDILETTDIRISMQADEFILAMMSFIHGLAAKQALLAAALSPGSTRNMVYAVFDAFVSRGERRQGGASSDRDLGLVAGSDSSPKRRPPAQTQASAPRRAEEPRRRNRKTHVD